jgi:hypothetical protein
MPSDAPSVSFHLISHNTQNTFESHKECTTIKMRSWRQANILSPHSPATEVSHLVCNQTASVYYLHSTVCDRRKHTQQPWDYQKACGRFSVSLLEVKKFSNILCKSKHTCTVGNTCIFKLQKITLIKYNMQILTTWPMNQRKCTDNEFILIIFHYRNKCLTTWGLPLL